MEKPLRKASRALNLAKPAPRKNGLTKDPGTVVTEEASTEKAVIAPEKNDKENRTVGKRALRCLKLEKPAPLKSSRINRSQDGNSGLSDVAPVKPKEDVVESQTKVKREDDISMTDKPAEMKANLLISEALADLEGSQQNSKPPTSMLRQTRLLSQVSDDSGLGDMSSSFSRQGSMLESLTENQDDLNWEDVDDSAVTTFSFGSEHLKCLATTVNKIQPFNSLLTNDNIQAQNLNQNACYKLKEKRARKLSHQNENTVNMKANISRSYSVPSNISTSHRKEFWDDELDFQVNVMAKVETAKSYQNQEIPKSDRIRSLSAQNSRVDLDVDNVRRRYNTCPGNRLNEKDIGVILTEGNRHSAQDVFTYPAKSFSDDWESEVVVVDVELCKYVDEEDEIERPSTPVNIKNPCENDTYSAVRKRNNRCLGNCINEKDIGVIPMEGNQHSSPDVFTYSTKSFSEDWESEVEVVDVELCKYVESDIERPSTPVNVQNPCENDTYSAIHYKGSDRDATPKAGSVLPKFSNNNSAVKLKLNSSESLRKCQKDSAEHPEESQQCDSATILENCDIPSAMMKNSPSYQDYRDKRDTDLNSSTTDTDDQISSCISDDSFNEQMYAWELIEDLSDRVNSLKLDQEKSDVETQNTKKESTETYDLKDEIPPKFVALPEDLHLIEAELEYMREDLELSESLKSDKTKSVHLVLKMARSGHDEKAVVKVIREPLSPYSPEDEIWRAEEGMISEFCKVKERRGMFRYYRQCQINDNESEGSALIQYSAKELLKLGTSMLSKKKPDSWPYLETIYPSICLEKVSSYFDCERYSQVRDYVAEVYNVQGDNWKNSSNTGARRNNSGLPDVRRPPPPLVTRGGFGAPKGGFGAPVKPFASEASCQDDQEKSFLQHQRSSTPVRFENDSETNVMSVSNEKQPQESFNEYVEFENIQVNLDRKCDVSVRNEGSLRLFEAATNKILPIKPAKELGVKRSISDPEGDRLSDFRRSTSYRVHRSNDDSDLLLNKDLPEVCPW
ncbi:uncharacterized protein LOC123548783 isoform X2 [Mercenaria mercenaria]|uniref:uncharacterized protein LOC123548783 isoform X2 n=1 Tax=Mercenaria mercenaria TaxID=6596 RepID=UPI00234E5800|nr:uncharacterized protein LOC123548783 isoform X2 [Mercenaria mercenaria]